MCPTARRPTPGRALSGLIRTCDLVAAAGTVTVPNFANPIPVWGFAIDPNPGTPTAPPPGTIPGPTLVADEGETLQFVVRNALPCLKAGAVVNYPCGAGMDDQNVLAVQIPGMTTSHTDDTGIPSGQWITAGDQRYTWKDLKPGTYVYEAGQTANGGRQLAMGLEGLLVVRPTGFSPASPSLFDAPVALAPVKGAVTNSTGSTTTTSAPASTSTTSSAPVDTSTTSTTSAPVDTSTASAPATTAAPTTTAAPAGAQVAAAAVTTTSVDPSATTTAAPVVDPTTTTAAPTVAPTTTAAPVVDPSTTTSAPSSTTTTAAPKGAGPSKSAPLLGAASPSACTSASAGASGFTNEALVQVNELSSQFHADPFASVMVPGGGNDPINTIGQNGPGGSPDIPTYVPDVFLINGKAYPNTDPISVTPTDCVALHFANFGMVEKSFGVLDQRETIVGDDSVQLTHAQSVATRYLNPGEEFDAVVDMTGSATGQQFPVMDFEHHLHNGAGTTNDTATPSSSTGMALGGQLTLLQVNGVDPAGTNPVIGTLGLDAFTVAAGGGVVSLPAALKLTTTGAAFGGNTIVGGKWMIDTIDAVPGTGLPAPLGGAVSGAGTASIATASLNLSNGDHTIWVRLQDSKGNWSAPAGIVFTYDTVKASNTKTTKCPDSPNDAGGPIVCNLSLDPTVTNGNTPNKTPGPIGHTDTATFPSGHTTITDASIVAGDVGQTVSGPGIPLGATVVTVTDGVSFMISAPTSAAGNNVTITIGTPGVPAVSSDMNIDGLAMPSLSDWAITGFSWQIDNIGSPTPIVLCTPDCGAGTPVELAGTIPASALAGLGDGDHTVSIIATETLAGTNNPLEHAGDDPLHRGHGRPDVDHLHGDAEPGRAGLRQPGQPQLLPVRPHRRDDRPGGAAGRIRRRWRDDLRPGVLVEWSVPRGSVHAQPRRVPRPQPVGHHAGSGRDRCRGRAARRDMDGGRRNARGLRRRAPHR